MSMSPSFQHLQRHGKKQEFFNGIETKGFENNIFLKTLNHFLLTFTLQEFTNYLFSVMRVSLPMISLDDELFLRNDWPKKGIKPYCQPGLPSEILTIANLQHAASRIWTCAEPEFRLHWMKLSSSDNHCTTVPKADYQGI